MNYYISVVLPHLVLNRLPQTIFVGLGDVNKSVRYERRCFNLGNEYS